MTMSEAWPVLEGRGWLSERSRRVRESLREIASVRLFERGEHVYVVGDGANGVFGLVRGALSISLPRLDGEDLVFHRADPGFWIGEAALLARKERLVSVRTVEDSYLVQLPADELLRLVDSNPGLVADFYTLTMGNVETILKLMGNLSVSPSDVRVAFRLLIQDEQLGSDDAWIRVSQEALAELVALSVPTLQRALRRFEDAGLVEIGYRRLRVVDRLGLLHLCGDVSWREQGG